MPVKAWTIYSLKRSKVSQFVVNCDPFIDPTDRTNGYNLGHMWPLSALSTYSISHLFCCSSLVTLCWTQRGEGCYKPGPASDQGTEPLVSMVLVARSSFSCPNLSGLGGQRRPDSPPIPCREKGALPIPAPTSAQGGSPGNRPGASASKIPGKRDPAPQKLSSSMALPPQVSFTLVTIRSRL